METIKIEVSSWGEWEIQKKANFWMICFDIWFSLVYYTRVHEARSDLHITKG